MGRGSRSGLPANFAVMAAGGLLLGLLVLGWWVLAAVGGWWLVSLVGITLWRLRRRLR